MKSYLRIEGEFLRMLELPARELTLNDLFQYVNSVFGLMTKYRLFFRDLLYLVDRVESLDRRYQQLTEGILAEGRAIFQTRVDAGVINADVQKVDLLTRNSWIIVTYWFTFLHVSGLRSGSRSENVRQGIEQFVDLFYSRLSKEGKRFVDEFDYATLVGNGVDPETVPIKKPARPRTPGTGATAAKKVVRVAKPAPTQRRRAVR